MVFHKHGRTCVSVCVCGGAGGVEFDEWSMFCSIIFHCRNILGLKTQQQSPDEEHFEGLKSICLVFLQQRS